MVRLAVNAEGRLGARVVLTRDDWHYVTHVMRRSPGDVLEVLCGDGQLFQARLGADGAVTLEKPVEAASELPREVTLYQALLKGDHFSAVVDRATQAGVNRIVPILSERCIVRNVNPNKAARWRHIVKEASEQSHRTLIPEIGEMLPVSMLRLPSDSEGFVLDPQAPYQKAWLNAQHRRVGIVVGPEGGWTPEEIAGLATAGFVPLSLGSRVFRSENAGAFAAVLFLQ